MSGRSGSTSTTDSEVNDSQFLFAKLQPGLVMSNTVSEGLQTVTEAVAKPQSESEASSESSWTPMLTTSLVLPSLFVTKYVSIWHGYSRFDELLDELLVDQKLTLFPSSDTLHYDNDPCTIDLPTTVYKVLERHQGVCVLIIFEAEWCPA